MSQFASIRTRIKDRRLLVKCLKELGYPVEEGRALDLYGDLDATPETADIVIRREYIDHAISDVGFRKVGEYYEMIISDYDQISLQGHSLLNLEGKVAEIQQRMIELENAIKRKYTEEKIRKTMEGLKPKGYKLRQRTEKGKQVVFEYVRSK